MTTTCFPSQRRSYTGTATTKSSAHLLVRLQREWDAQSGDPWHVRRATRWGVVDGPIRSLDDVLHAVGHDVERTPATEEALLRLLAVAVDDTAAARVVLQRILPNLAALARRAATSRATSYDEEMAVLDDLVGAAWTVIRTFDPRRRPAAVAQALAVDARDRAVRAGSRRQWTVQYVPTTVLDQPVLVDADDDPLLELADLVRHARAAGMSDTDLDFVRCYLAGRSGREVADTLAVTPRTVRNRRDAVVARLRAMLAA